MKRGNEWRIQRDLISYLKDRDWLVERLTGNAYQKGIPDLYIYRRDWGERWIDVKDPKRYSFTPAQREKWPIWSNAGVGIWILTAATQAEYDKLFKPPNWKDYWKKSWDKLNVNAIIEELGRGEQESE